MYAFFPTVERVSIGVELSSNGWKIAIGCAVLALVAVVVGGALTVAMYMIPVRRVQQPAPAPTIVPAAAAPELSLASPRTTTETGEVSSVALADLYNAVNPGVVNIRVLVSDGPGNVGLGAGSGFVLDDQGHVVTNHHVVFQATDVIVVFFDGSESAAEIVGLDDDSDLAILRVSQQPEGVRALPLADSDLVQVGDWAVAIGNPFGLGSSLTLGVVSAAGRSIPSGATPFAIPQAIQTDAAINPGNSGGPLLSLAGQVIGVNAQIRTTDAGVNSGVGFSIPSNVVRHIAPQLIERGFYEWPWLGVEGSSVNLLIMQANGLDSQFGAYISGVVEGGPADDAGLRGTQGMESIGGVPTPVGGDVVVAIGGERVRDFDDLLSHIAFAQPGEEVVLTVIRDGRSIERTVELEARPRGPNDS